MPIHRRRFRIEQPFVGDMPMAAGADGDIGPMHHEIMSELRAIRAQMGSSGTGKSVAVETIGASVTREIAEALAQRPDGELGGFAHHINPGSTAPAGARAG